MSPEFSEKQQTHFMSPEFMATRVYGYQSLWLHLLDKS